MNSFKKFKERNPDIGWLAVIIAGMLLLPATLLYYQSIVTIRDQSFNFSLVNGDKVCETHSLKFMDYRYENNKYKIGSYNGAYYLYNTAVKDSIRYGVVDFSLVDSCESKNDNT